MKSHQKIMHLITTLDRGGAEKQLLILVRNQIKKENKVFVFYLKGSGALSNDLIEAGAIVYMPHQRNFLWNIYEVKLRIEQIKPDVVHTHLPRAEILARILKAFMNFKFVVTRHNSEPFFPRFGYPVSAILSRWVLRKAHRLICISEATRYYLIQNREVSKLTQEKMIIVKYGFDETLKSRERKRDFEYVIGTISRLTPQKNIAIQLEALKIVRQQSKRPWCLKIIGSGGLEENLKDRVKLLNLEGQVEFIRHVPDVRYAFAQFDIFILSSLYEGFGLVLLEAMQSEVPILASNISAIPEVLGKDYPGLFDPRRAEQLANLILRLESHQEQSEITKRYDQRLTLFDPRLMSERVLQAYNSDFTIE